MGNPIIQGWMRKKPMCFVSICLSYQVLHFGHTVKLTFVCCKMYIKTNPITLKLVLTHLTKAAFHLLSDRKEVQVKDTTGQQDATIHHGVTNYTDFYIIYLCIELHVKVGMTHRVLLESMKENPHFLFYTTSYSNWPHKRQILRVQGYHQLKMLQLYFDVRMSFGGNTQMLLRYCKR